MSSVTGEKAIITIEVELVSKVTGDLEKPTEQKGGFFEERPDDIREYINQEIEKANEEALANVLTEEDVSEIKSESIDGAVSQIEDRIPTLEDITSISSEFINNAVKQVEDKFPTVDDVRQIIREEFKTPGEDEEFESDVIEGMIEVAVAQQIKDAVDDALEESDLDMDSLKDASKLFTQIKGQGVQNVKSMAQNPAGFMESTIMGVLSKAGPYGALAAAIIGAVAASPEMVKAVVEALGVKGGPLNQDYAFTEEEQMNLAFDRAVQFKRLTGDDPVITVTTKGFVSGDPDFVDNSLVTIEQGRTGRVGLRESSLGLIHGI